MAEPSVQKSSNLCVSTHVGRKEDQVGTLIMTIDDIKGKIKSAKPGEGFTSDTLECGNMEFTLKIYPNGRKLNTKGKISAEVFVNKKNPGRKHWKSMEFLMAKNSTGAFLHTQKQLMEELIKGDEGYSNGVTMSLPHELVVAKKNLSFFLNGVLTVKVIIVVQGEETVTHKTTKLPDESITASQLKGELTKHFRNMLETHQRSDFRIICQEEIIPCHKLILSARSDYFAAMMENDMKEAKTGQVEIKDFDLETVKAVVLHIYTGEVEYNEENTNQLMRAADKYRLEGLKKKMEDVLIKAVKIQNAIDMFVLGDAVHADKLRDVSKEIIVNNAVAIVETDEGWKQKLGRFNNLTLEMFEAVVKSKAHA